MLFADLGLSDELLRAVTEAGYSEPTPIQAAAIPSVLMMRDLIGIAQTGTGKTAAFVLPMIDVLGEGRSRARMPRSLILEPTRELAAQVAENFDKYGKYHKLSMALLIGGVSMTDQMKALEKGVDVLIATPGRLMDLFGRGKILLTGCDLLVIDEADRMLDMGFIPDIEEICTKLPKQRQTLLFSATMPAPIKRLADKFLTNPKTIEVARPATANVNITQWLVPVTADKKRVRLKQLLQQEEVRTAIIFCNRKTTVRDLNKFLKRDRFRSAEIHGDMDQPARIAELDRFKDGDVNILVASDVAARGLDIKGVSHVFNYDAPWHPDDYIHRIGRTGRAGATGVAYTFAAPDDGENIANIEKLTGMKIPRIAVVSDAVEPTETAAEPADAAGTAKEGPRSRGRGRGRKTQESRQAEAREPEAQTPEAREHEPSQPEAGDGEAPRPEAPRASGRRRAAADRPSEMRAPRGDRPRRDEPRGRRRDLEDNEPDNGWNGPVPDFLSVTLTSG